MKAVKRKKWNEWMSFQQESDTLLEATLNLESDQVAKQIEKIHTEYVSMIQYNDENSLSSVLTIGYLSAMKYYFKPIRSYRPEEDLQISYLYRNPNILKIILR